MTRLSKWLRNYWVWSIAGLLVAALYCSTTLDAQDPNSVTSAANEDTPVTVSAYDVFGADPQTVLDVLQTHFKGRTDLNLAIDPQTKRIIVRAKATDHKAIEEIIQKLVDLKGSDPLADNTTNQSLLYARLSQEQSALVWEPFDEPRLQQLVSMGYPVMVYFTAEWSANGKRNLEVAIHTPKVRETVNKNKVISMIADLTRYPSELRGQLKKVLNSNSLPLLALYRPKQLEQPIMLRDLFTESQMLHALEDAGVGPTSSKDAAPAGGDKGAGSSVGSVDSVLSPPVMTWSNPPGTKPDWLIRGENAMRARERVRRKLDESKELEFNNQPLGSVLMYLSDAYGFPIHGNAKSLEKAMVTLEEPITLNATGSLRGILLRILDPLGLDYIVLEDGLEIRTGREAILYGAVLSYNLAAITNSSSEGERIVDTIKKMIQPDAWDANGGDASCQLIGTVLLVKASEGMHEEIQNLLAQLNALRPDDTK